MKNALSAFSKSTTLTLGCWIIVGLALRNMRWAPDMLLLLDLKRNETITSHLLAMARSDSKGELLNAAQMMACLGQTAIEGKSLQHQSHH
jgi:hypothetical protein